MDTLAGAYGGGLSGGSFNPIKFVKRPQVILRIVAWVFSIIVFGSISSGGWVKDEVGAEKCVFNKSGGACSFASAIGVFAFICCIGFLAADAYFDRISSVNLRKKVVIGDLGASGVFTFLFFIIFCMLAKKWSSTEFSFDYRKGPPRTAITFSLFSIFVWGGLLFYAWRRYQQGVATAFAPSYEQDFSSSGGAPYGYPTGPAGGTESYQEPPFSASNEGPGAQQFGRPTY